MNELFKLNELVIATGDYGSQKFIKGKIGTIIGTDLKMEKILVEFHQPIPFGHDGINKGTKKGKPGHCYFLPPKLLKKMYIEKRESKSLLAINKLKQWDSTSGQKATDSEQAPTLSLTPSVNG